jgi:hypothetical protein
MYSILPFKHQGKKPGNSKMKHREKENDLANNRKGSKEITEGPRKVGRRKSNINGILIILLKILNYPHYKYYPILPIDK